LKVLVSDKLAEVGVHMFQEAEDIDVDVKVGLPPEELKTIIGDYDGLVIRSATKVTAEILEAAPRLKVIGRAGIGLDNVDIPAATKRGVVVMNTPEGNVITTAEHAVAMMLALSRNIPQGTASLKQGRWEKKKLQGKEIFGKTLGVLGYGRIGSIVADRARGLKMKVIVHDPYANKELIEQGGCEVVSREELFARSDYITIHVPKMKETVNLVNKGAFDQMKPGVMLIHCARGGIVNEKDLTQALASGQVGGVALDVFETEPPGESPLLRHDNVICTPHREHQPQKPRPTLPSPLPIRLSAIFRQAPSLTPSMSLPSPETHSRYFAPIWHWRNVWDRCRDSWDRRPPKNSILNTPGISPALISHR